MKLAFASRKLKKQLADEREMTKAYGHAMPALKRRLDLMRTVRCLADVPQTPPSRRHELSGKRAGQFTLDLTANWRLIFRPDHDPVPRSSDGGIDLTAVTDIVIIEIVDYHGN